MLDVLAYDPGQHVFQLFAHCCVSFLMMKTFYNLYIGILGGGGSQE